MLSTDQLKRLTDESMKRTKEIYDHYRDDLNLAPAEAANLTLSSSLLVSVGYLSEAIVDELGQISNRLQNLDPNDPNFE